MGRAQTAGLGRSNRVAPTCRLGSVSIVLGPSLHRPIQGLNQARDCAHLPFLVDHLCDDPLGGLAEGASQAALPRLFPLGICRCLRLANDTNDRWFSSSRFFCLLTLEQVSWSISSVQAGAIGPWVWAQARSQRFVSSLKYWTCRFEHGNQTRGPGVH